MNNNSYPKSTFSKIFVFILLFIAMNAVVIFLSPVLGVSKSIANIILAVGFCSYILYGFCLYLIYKRNINGPAFEKWQKKKIYLALIIFVIMFFVQWTINILKVTIIGHIETPANQVALEQIITQKTFESYVTILYGALLAPVVEEFLFRGILMNYFFKHAWWWANIILSGFVFALPHMLSERNLFQLSFLMNYSIYMLMGCALAYVYKKTGKIQYSIFMHFLNNCPMLLLLLMH